MATRRSRILIITLVVIVFMAGCARPEAARVRGGGPGGDPKNRTEVVQMHEGSLPYHGTPRLIEPYGHPALAPARQAHELSLQARGDSDR